MKWRFWRRPKPRTRLYAFRYADMLLVRPDMNTDHVCSRCKHQVGLWPSGMAALAQYPNAEIVCQRCELPINSQPAPGAMAEQGTGVLRQ